MDFSSAAGELYGVPPSGFVATRKRLAQEAKDAGDRALAKRIGELRRPTLSAWAVNLLARSAAEDLERLLDVGAEIRAAWGSGGGLGDLEQRRARLVGSLVRTAADLAAEAGGPLREQALREVEDTLQAATVDADIADGVRAGRLSQPRSHTGFVPAGFPMAPQNGQEGAKPKAEEKKAEEKPPAKAPAREKPAMEPAEAEEPVKAKGRGRSNVTRTSAARARRAETLRRRAEAADRRLAERRERAEAASREAEEASAEVGRLRHELDRAIAGRDAAVRRAERAAQHRARAEEEAREAREAAREARRAADRDARHG
ncbi:hypothetical protein [Actinomadura livida]|uniref:Uncharacterized protein n=1 Tax=Actinomadura livida TaxID=79909 RepID=A0A7W7IFH0_9ACTN|nr:MULTISPECIES: hypothetical protein [Actinomadura]MBB4775743.1 hypothetical protein [Actinomadura catellatispora]GGU34821.1 hypothetical protein GCM10010208_69320 [Actinomadura livida]